MVIANVVALMPLKERKALSKGGFGTFDIETKDGLIGKELFCWSFTYSFHNSLRQIIGIDEPLDKMFEYLSKKKHKSRYFNIYVHNLDFERAHIEQFLVDRSIKFKPIRSGSKMIAMICKDFMVKFIDSAQFLLSTQEKAEIAWDIPEKYRKIDCQTIFETPFEQWSESDKEKVVAHNQNDSMALYLIMKRFRKSLWELLNVDILSVVSLASLTMKGYRRQLTEPIINPFLGWKRSENGKPNYWVLKEEEAFVRKSYFGGRTEVFDLNRHNDIAYFDRNSMYPAEMRNQKFPLGQPEWIRNKDRLMKIIKNEDERLGFIHAIVKPPNSEQYPLLPIRMNQKVCFTNTTRKWVYTSVELVKAFKMGYDIMPIEGLIYPDSGYIFRDYIDKLYEYRQKFDKENHAGQNRMAKICMNSLYGKFGQKIFMRAWQFKAFDNRDKALDFMQKINMELKEELSELEQEYGFIPESQVSVKLKKGSRYFVVKYLEKQVSKKTYQNVGLASFTTAYARINLYEKLKEMESHGIPVLYCDTDSISMDAKFIDKLQMGDELGQWKVEETFSQIKFLAPKCYFGYKEDGKLFLKAKGVDSRKVRQMLSECIFMEEIEQKLRNTIEIDEKYAKFALSHDNGEIFYSTKSTKKFRYENHKRLFREDGTSIPLNDNNLPSNFTNKGEIAL